MIATRGEALGQAAKRDATRGWSPQTPVLAAEFGQCGPGRRMPGAVTGCFEQMKGRSEMASGFAHRTGDSFARSTRLKAALLLGGQLRYRDIALDIKRS